LGSRRAAFRLESARGISSEDESSDILLMTVFQQTLNSAQGIELCIYVSACVYFGGVLIEIFIPSAAMIFCLGRSCLAT
jgi:hypothetical protein